MSQYAHQDAKLWQRVKIGRSIYTAIGRRPDGVMLWKGSGPTIYTLIEKAQGEWGLGRFDDKLFAHPVAQQFSRLSTEIKRHIRAQQKAAGPTHPGAIVGRPDALPWDDLTEAERAEIRRQYEGRGFSIPDMRNFKVRWIKRYGLWEYRDARSNPGGRVRKNIFVFNNSPSGPADEHAARELELYIDNDSQLYHSQFIPIVKNLMLKRRKGIYNRELAVKLFMYLMDAGAKKYVREFGTSGQKIDAMFNKNTRLLAARAFRDSFETEAELGNYDRLIGPVSNPRSVRRNIFTFNNPRRALNSMEQAAAAVGLVIGTWAPGDGVTRYRFFLSDGKSRYGDYHQGDGLYTALGRKDAMAFIAAYGKGRSARRNPKGSSVYVIEGFTHQGRRGQTKRYGEFRTPSFEKARARAEQIFQETGSVVAITQRNPLTRAEAGYLLRHARRDIEEARSARSRDLTWEQKYHTGRARGIGFAVQETGPKAAKRAWVTMHTTLDRVLRNPPACSNPVIRGDKLPKHLQDEVLRIFIYRWTTGNTQRESAWKGLGKPRIPLISDAQWLREHAFHVTKDGRLSLKHHHAEPYYMADDWKKGDPRPNPLLQTIGLVANPPISATWDRLTGRQRLELLDIVRADEYLARRSWSALPAMVRSDLEHQWYDTSAPRRGDTTRRRYAPVGANPLTRREAGQVLRDARFDVRHGSIFQAGHTRSSRAGMAFGKAKVVRQYGPRVARRAANRISDEARKVARTTMSNPGSLRLPKPGTRLTVTQALELARRIGDRGLIVQCEKALKLQKAANRSAKCVIWKTFPMGSPNKIDQVVALTHYGDTPETMYKPPKGSRKGQHMYRHKWGEGSNGKKTVPLLASADGKMLLMPLEGRKVASDWLRH